MKDTTEIKILCALMLTTLTNNDISKYCAFGLLILYCALGVYEMFKGKK